MKKVLMCPPLYYDIDYEINPWMHIDNKVDQKKVREEFARLKAVYQSLEVEILEIEQGKDLPDMVYAANYGSPHGKMFILANFKYPERRGESAFAKTYFEKLGFIIKELPEGIFFEGQGDLLTIGGKYFFGYGKRSDPEAKKYLEEFLGGQVHAFKLIDPYYYHLDTCFTPLDEKTIMVNPHSFDEEGIARLKTLFPNIIYTSEEDNTLIACNAVVVGKKIVVGADISQALKDELLQYGYETTEVPMEEYRKGGGSVKCLTLEFYE